MFQFNDFVTFDMFIINILMLLRICSEKMKYTFQVI